MSTPTDQFANLSIESVETPMPPTDQQVKDRATELQDILSSFDVNELPIEFQASIFKNITGKRLSGLRPRQTEWTIPGNLSGTLLQWGAYNEQGWRFLKEIQLPESRAIAFYQKLNRRFEACFEEYDALEPSSGAVTLRDNINRIAEDLYILSTATCEDRRRRQLREADTLEVVLRALASICKRNAAIIPAGPTEPSRRSSRRTASLSGNGLSLFAAVIRHFGGSSDNEPFLLKALELFSSAALRACLPQLVFIDGLLNTYAAGDEYIRRFEALQEKANEATGSVSDISDVPGPSGGGNGGRDRGHNLQAEPRPGSKRAPHPAGDITATQKRGKISGPK